MLMPGAIGLYRAVLVLVGATGIAMELARAESLDPFVYFTIQSNAVLVVFFAWAAWSVWRQRGDPPAGGKGAVTVYILITGLVFNFVLAESPTQLPAAHAGQLIGGPWWFVDSSDLLHTVTPLMAAVDFVLFDQHRRMRWYYALLWLGYPLAYVCFTTVRGALFPITGYPYFFIDVSLLGYAGLLRSVAVYGSAFLVLGALLVTADRLLGAAVVERLLAHVRGERSVPAVPAEAAGRPEG